MKASKRIKQILVTSWLSPLMSYCIYGYICLVYRTSQWSYIKNEDAQPYVAGEQNGIFVFWHGRLMMMPHFRPAARTTHVIISHHNDGEFISRILNFFHIDVIRGSSRRGGLQAFIRARTLLNAGDNVCITPDGPKGPRMRISGNVIALAQLTGKPIIPVTYSTSSGRLLSSWDRFLFAKPFANMIMRYGMPVTIPAEASADDLETLRITLEKELNHITVDTDTLLGQPIVLPDDDKL